ncbi:MAG: hypothetical protein GYB31_06885 [Bacteroidetes bacterium]|nr:hypothetical protein [Bacteroidota bacterium]
MIKKLIFYILILAFFPGFTSCKKYVDGPYLSIQSKKKRVIGDWYVLQVISPDNFDVTAQYQTYTFHFEKDSVARIAYSNFGIPDTIDARWYLGSNKDSFEWILDRVPDNFIFDSLTVFDISRLTANDFWLFDKFNNQIRLDAF